MPVPFNPFDPAWIIEQFKASDTAVPPAEEVMLNRLPTADPHVKGQAWNNSNVVNISNG